MTAATRSALEVAVAALAAAATAGLALERAGAWQPGRPVVVALVVLTAVLAVASTSVRAVGGALTRRRDRRRDLHEDVLSAALWAVVDSTAAAAPAPAPGAPGAPGADRPLDVRDLALAVYLLRGGRLRAPRLERVHRVRARRRPVASGVRWAPGKGVIGACVATGEVVARDVAALEAAGERQGLDEQELRAVRGKYAVVVAVPLLDDTGATSRVTGCLALDGPAGTLPALSTPAVLAVLEATARTLQRLGDTTPAAVAAAAAVPPALPEAERERGERRLRAALERQDSPPERVAAAGGRLTP
ncbi:hypothetical protein [Kineococcus sp. SYSU DK006]|uniref:hypothetical protein n=1 Tax=Kineococcus sp. SYSU DK006 TaxID=3383127 RepID=UPI003D7DAD21